MTRTLRSTFLRAMAAATLAHALGGATAVGQCPELVVGAYNNAFEFSFGGTLLPKVYKVTDNTTGAVVATYPAGTVVASLAPSWQLGLLAQAAIATKPISQAVIASKLIQPVTITDPVTGVTSVPPAMTIDNVIHWHSLDATQGITNGHIYAIKASCDGTNFQTVQVNPPGWPYPPTVALTSSNPLTLSWTPPDRTRWVYSSFGAMWATSPSGPWTGMASGLTANSYTFPPNKIGGKVYVSIASIGVKWGPPATGILVNLPPVQPQEVKATATYSGTSYASAQLEWAKSMGATSYEVGSGAASAGPFTFGYSGTTNTTFTVPGLTNGTTYYFVVRATGPTGQSVSAPLRYTAAKVMQ